MLSLQPRIPGTTQSVETPQRAPRKKRSSCRRARNKLLQGRLSNRRSEHFQAQTDHNIEGQDVYCRQWCFLARDGESSLSRRKRKPYDRPKSSWRSKPQTSMASSVPLARRGFTSRISAPTFYWKLVEDSTSELSLRRLCDELEYSYSWQPGRNPTLTKGKEDNHALYRQFRFSRRSHSAKSYSICQARARQGKPLRQTQKWRKLV